MLKPHIVCVTVSIVTIFSIFIIQLIDTNAALESACVWAAGIKKGERTHGKSEHDYVDSLDTTYLHYLKLKLALKFNSCHCLRISVIMRSKYHSLASQFSYNLPLPYPYTNEGAGVTTVDRTS